MSDDPKLKQAEKEFEENEVKKQERESAKKRVLADLENTSKKRIDFSKYEYNTKFSKQALLDLCEQYKVYADSDKSFVELFNLVDEYARLDADAHQNYEKEQKLIKGIYENIEECRISVEKENDNIIKDAKVKFDPKNFNKLNSVQQEKLNTEFVYREEMADTKNAILGSLGVYFDTLTNGNLEDPTSMPNPDPRNERKLEKSKQNKGQKYALSYLDGYKKNTVFYIDGTGVKIDQRVDPDEFKDKIYQLSKFGASVVNQANAPLFPHEPRMNDIQQLASGNCYMLAGLADLAKSRPQQIKDMIRDNGDGTATVRFYEKNGNNYTPVYVKVDKQVRKVAKMTQGGENCLWVSVIEQAYVLSGIHKRAVDTNNKGEKYLAADKADLDRKYEEKARELAACATEEEKKIFLANLKAEEPLLFDAKGNFKKWDPALNDIFGGDTSLFLQTCFGPKYKAYELNISNDVDSHINKQDDFLNLNKSLNQSDSAEVLRALMCGEYFTGFDEIKTKTNEDYATATYEILNDLEKRMVTLQEFTGSVNTMMNKVEEMIRAHTQDGKFICNTVFCDELKNYMKGIEEGSNTPFGLRYASNYILQNIVRNAEKYSEFFANKEAYIYSDKKNHEKVYAKMKYCLDNGLPITAGSRAKTKHIASTHAYTVIGAYETEDNPPKKMIRLRNPWADAEIKTYLGIQLTKRPGAIEYTKDGIVAAQKEHGIFDIEFDDFCSEMSEIRYNESKELLSEPFFKEQGYDAIRQDEIENEPKEIIGSEAYLEYLKCANDIHKSLLKTNGFFTRDSIEYKNLMKESQSFRETVVKSRGQNFRMLRAACLKLREKAEAYIGHVPEKPGKRQLKRLAVCETIKKLEAPIRAMSKEPRKAFETQFAKAILLDMDPEKYRNNALALGDAVDTLVNTKVFETAMKKYDFHEICNITNEKVNECIKTINQIGKGVEKDKGFDLKNIEKMKQEPIV